MTLIARDRHIWKKITPCPRRGRGKTKRSKHAPGIISKNGWNKELLTKEHRMKKNTQNIRVNIWRDRLGFMTVRNTKIAKGRMETVVSQIGLEKWLHKYNAVRANYYSPKKGSTVRIKTSKKYVQYPKEKQRRVHLGSEQGTKMRCHIEKRKGQNRSHLWRIKNINSKNTTTD